MGEVKYPAGEIVWIRYLNKKGYDTVVIYSDFETNTYTLHDEAKAFGKDLSFIVVNNGCRYRSMDPNRIIEDQKSLVRRVIEFKP